MDTFTFSPELTARKQNQKAILTDWLRRIKTMAELSIFLRVAGWYGYGLYGKRNRHYAYGWSVQADGRVRYLFDDGISVGKAKISNIYKYFDIK